MSHTGGSEMIDGLIDCIGSPREALGGRTITTKWYKLCPTRDTLSILILQATPWYLFFS